MGDTLEQMVARVSMYAHINLDAFETVRHEYNWESWFSGDLLMLEKGTDYYISTKKMVARVRKEARRRNVTVEVSLFGPDGERLKDALIIRATPV